MSSKLNIRTILSSALLMFIHSAFASAGSLNMEVKVTAADYGPDGTSLDGRRIYLLPFEATTVTPPELAVCAYTSAPEIVCAPRAGGVSSPCPDSKSCTFTLTFEKEFTDVTISIFDIDAIGHDTIDQLGGFVHRSLRWAENQSDRDLKSDQFRQAISGANSRRWSWIETASFSRLNGDQGEPMRNPEVEKFARHHAEELSPPGWSDFGEGRIAAPFDLRALGDCVYPMPDCSYAYSQITIRSNELEMGGSR